MTLNKVIEDSIRDKKTIEQLEIESDWKDKKLRKMERKLDKQA